MNRLTVWLTSILSVVVVLVVGILLYAFPPADKNYLDKVNAYSFWQNDKDSMISQPEIGKFVANFLATPSNKTKKVAFLGFDAFRVDALLNVIDDENSTKGLNADANNSAFALMKNNGYMYLAYAGGEKGTDTQQNTQTAPGWTALATGVWGNVNGVQANGDYRKGDTKTVILNAAKDYGMRSLFIVSYRSYLARAFDCDYEYAKSNNIDMITHYVDNDTQMQEYLLNCVEVGNPLERDFIFAIYKDGDACGHMHGFSNSSNEYVDTVIQADQMAYELIQAIYNRPTFEQEDWLIVLTADHGGKGIAHGGQSDEERTIFFISNKEYPLN